MIYISPADDQPNKDEIELFVKDENRRTFWVKPAPDATTMEVLQRNGFMPHLDTYGLFWIDVPTHTMVLHKGDATLYHAVSGDIILYTKSGGYRVVDKECLQLFGSLPTQFYDELRWYETNNNYWSLLFPLGFEVAPYSYIDEEGDERAKIGPFPLTDKLPEYPEPGYGYHPQGHFRHLVKVGSKDRAFRFADGTAWLLKYGQSLRQVDLYELEYHFGSLPKGFVAPFEIDDQQVDDGWY